MDAAMAAGGTVTEPVRVLGVRPSPELYGSRRPLDEKQRTLQLERIVEMRARKALADWKHRNHEEQQRVELESKTKSLRAMQRPQSARKPTLGSSAERAHTRQRLYASPRRARVGKVYS